jgi:hypothetical protein
MIEEKDGTKIEAEELLRTLTKVKLIVTTILFGLLGASLFLPLLMSVMAFDSPGSEKSITTWIGFLSIFTFSPICFLSIIFSWFSFFKKNYKLATFISFTPLINVIILLCGFVFTYIKDSPARFSKKDKENKEYIERSVRFEELCKDDRIRIFDTAENVKSIFFPNYRLNETWWLWKENLDFVETRHFDKEKNPIFTRTIKDLTPQKEGAGQYPTLRLNIDKPEAQYEVDYKDVTSAQDKGKSISVKEFVVINRQNNKVLARYSSVETPENHCPPAAIRDHLLLSYILGTMDKNKTDDFKSQISNYHSSLP